MNLQWFTNFAGDDGLNRSGGRAYTSYFQVSAPFALAGCDWTATVGAVPYATDYYSEVNGFAVTNLSLRAGKVLKICKKFSLPLFVEGTCNPTNKKGYLVAGATLSLKTIKETKRTSDNDQ